MENEFGDRDGGKEGYGEATIITEIRYCSCFGQNNNTAGFKKSSDSRLCGRSDFLTDDMWRVRKRKQ